MILSTLDTTCSGYYM